MQNEKMPTERQNSTKLEAESALRGAACCASFVDAEVDSSCPPDYAGAIREGYLAPLHVAKIPRVIDVDCIPVDNHCQNGHADLCLAARVDGVVCPHDSCDIDEGVVIIQHNVKHIHR